jgi:ankyrin repeat protein
MSEAEDVKGASNNERLLAAARADNEDLLLEVFQQGDFNINCQDGLGNTPLHNAVMHGSTDVLEHILSHDECDVDPINRIEKATPLHLALQIQHIELRLHVFESLLDAGADTSIKDKNGETVIDLLPEDDVKLRALLRKSQAQASVSRADVASDGDDNDGEYSGSGSDDD